MLQQKQNINNILPVDPSYTTIYLDKIDKGKELLLKSNVVVAGLCRNLGHCIKNNLLKIIQILDHNCLDYKIVLFENDSTDNTINEILSLKNHNIILLSQNYNRPQFGTVKDKERIDALAEYRNIIKEHIKINYSNFDFTIIMDMDFIDISNTGFFNSFGWLKEYPNIDAMSGNSFEIKDIFNTSELMLWNYDSWAFRGSWWDDLQGKKLTEHYNNYNRMLWFGLWILPVGSRPISVNSAFGGMCIYKTKHYTSGQYASYDCEHVTFHYDISNKNPGFALCLNPSQVMLMS
jgi:hypothetical protein